MFLWTNRGAAVIISTPAINMPTTSSKMRPSAFKGALKAAVLPKHQCCEIIFRI